MTRLYTSKHLGAMHDRWGMAAHKCGQCAHYQAKSMYCRLFPTEPYRHGQSASWATNWAACGRFELRDG